MQAHLNDPWSFVNNINILIHVPMATLEISISDLQFKTRDASFPSFDGNGKYQYVLTYNYIRHLYSKRLAHSFKYHIHDRG